jgi:membrane dipeptidase
MSVPANALTERARAFHAGAFTLDSHCDTPLSLARRGYDPGIRHPAGTLLGGDVDLPRMREGGLAAAFFAVFVGQGPRTPEGYAQARQAAQDILDRLDRMFESHADGCARALTPADARRIHAGGRRAIFLGMENGYPLGLDPALLDGCHRRGVRYLTLCHVLDNDLCAACTTVVDGCMVERPGADPGLSELGAGAVRRMNRLGMLVDVSHVSGRTIDDVLGLSQAPVLASHSGARAVADHPRNLGDAHIRAIAAAGGVVQVTFVPEFLRPAPADPAEGLALMDLHKRVKRHYAAQPIGAQPEVDAAFEREHQELRQRFPPAQATVADVADHIDHVVKLSGVEHVGIGSDFDGGGWLADCRDASELPALTAELFRRGYREEQLEQIWGGNLMRVLQAAQDWAAPKN